MSIKTYRHLLLALVFPWLAVTLARGDKRQKRTTWLLELLGHVPAVVYAMFVIVQREQPGSAGQAGSARPMAA